MKMSDRFSRSFSRNELQNLCYLLTVTLYMMLAQLTLTYYGPYWAWHLIKPTLALGLKYHWIYDSFQIDLKLDYNASRTQGGMIRTGGMEALGTYSVTSGEGGDNVVTTAPTIFGTGNTVLDGAMERNSFDNGGDKPTITPVKTADVTTNTAGTAVINLNGQTLRADENATIYTVDTKKTTQTETAFGVAMVGKLNDKLSVTAGYNMATAKQHEFKVNTTMTTDASRMVGSSTAVDKFNLETKKPKIHNCYAGVQFSF